MPDEPAPPSAPATAPVSSPSAAAETATASAPGPAAAPAPWAAPVPDRCQVCGSTPAATVALQQHIGMVVLMRWRRLRPTVCRDCGIAFFRDIQARTLLTGWWGFLSFLGGNWIAIFTNLRARATILRLAAPQRDPGAQSLRAAPLPPGAPLVRRWQTYVGLAAVAIVVVAVVASRVPSSGSPSPIVDASDRSLVGKCVRISGDSLQGTVDCTASHDGVIDAAGVTVDATLGADCPHAADEVYSLVQSGGVTVGTVGVCVDRTNSRP